MKPSSYLRQQGLQPRKRLGQHFLVSDEILSSIAAAAGLQPDDQVVEVGPGLGALTTVLAQQAGRVLAVELDESLAGKLGELTSAHANIDIVRSDILKLDLEQALWKGSPPANAGYKVVANLPYYITTPILRYFFERDLRPSLVVITVQEEVARRIVAAPPEMNFLAVLVQFYGEAAIVRSIPPGAFYPPPKVHSAVVRIRMRPTLPLDGPATRRFLRVVSAGFSQPRKQIHNPLAQGLALNRDDVAAALVSAGIDPSRRAATLALDEWLALNRAVER